MNSYDDVWSDNRTPTMAIPDHAVGRYRTQSGESSRTDEEVRDLFRGIVSQDWKNRVALSEMWGHKGFAIETVQSGRKLFLIFNPDRKTDYDYVLVTVYNEDQFRQRMHGQFFNDTDLNRPDTRFDDVRARQQRGNQAPMTIRIFLKTNHSQQDFDSEEEALKHLESLIKKGISPNDWEVWKKVKTEIVMT